MIIVRARVLRDKDGRKFLQSPIIFDELKFDNDHKFDFDIFDALEWKHRLQEHVRPDGKGLPRYSESGEPYRYDVYIFGGKYTGKALFPGYDTEGNKLHPRDYGILD